MQEIKKNDPMDTIGEEIEAAKKQAQADTVEHFTLHLTKPFNWEGNDYTEMEFDFDGMTGADFINIEAELQSQGYGVIAPEFSTMFLMTMTMRCCKQPIGTDSIEKLPFPVFCRLRSKARSFLLNMGM